MDETWQIERLEIRGGFLDGVNLRLSPGLTCVIGPRGSGKSTLAEALRWALAGIENASKPRLDLFKANLQKATVSVRTQPGADGEGYTVRREFRQTPLLATLEGRPVPLVDLDRGTFLPLDAYSSYEIEEIADQTLGPRRRLLIDELRPTELAGLQDHLAAARRELRANADTIRARSRLITSLTEQIQALGDAQARLEELPKQTEDPVSQPLQAAARQQQLNKKELAAVADLHGLFAEMETQAVKLAASRRSPITTSEPGSANLSIGLRADQIAEQLSTTVKTHVDSILVAITSAKQSLDEVKDQLLEVHAQQAVDFADFQEMNQAAGQAAKERADAEQAVARLARLKTEQHNATTEKETLLLQRRDLRARYIELREKVSVLREQIATEVLKHAGDHVRVRVRRHADNLEYQQTLARALHGAGLRGHDAIVDSLLRCRPDELAHFILTKNVDELDNICRLGLDRSGRILDAFARELDPLDLEILILDDLISIELNVGNQDMPLYKDAADLSRGQKCTALLPLLLARRRAPLLIDQPEDNLDNHFIFRTVVESIRRLRPIRQMIFITHNANIPVLGDADMVVVMGSDGRTGYIQKQGSVDECQQEIIDLLEGGRDAFELRRQRYARR